MTDWKFVERVGVAAGSIMGIAGVVALFGFSIDPPWASAEEVKAVEQQVEQIKTDFKRVEARQDKQNDIQLQIQRVQMQAQLKEAEEDLRANPNSRSAAKAVEDARDAIKAIDKALEE